MARAMSLVVLLAANAASPALAAKGARRLSSITGYVMTDSNIFDAVELWLLDEDAADIKYGHITAWDTSAVTDMSCLFKAEEDNGGQCTYPRFYHAAAASFDEDLSGWDVGNVRKMAGIFVGAEAFDQDLGWCVAADDLDEEQGAFYGSARRRAASRRASTPPAAAAGRRRRPRRLRRHVPHGREPGRPSRRGSPTRRPRRRRPHLDVEDRQGDGHVAVVLASWGDAFNEDISAWGLAGGNHRACSVATPAGRVQSTDRRLGRVFRRDMSGMFQSPRRSTKTSGWSPISVKDMSSLFEGATAFDQTSAGASTSARTWA